MKSNVITSHTELYRHNSRALCFLFSRCVRILGKLENIRVVQLSLFQGVAKAMQVAPTVEMKASDNPALQNVEPDPTIFCSAFKKNRFYLVRQKGIHFKVTALHFFLSYYKFFVVSF